MKPRFHSKIFSAGKELRATLFQNGGRNAGHSEQNIENLTTLLASGKLKILNL